MDGDRIVRLLLGQGGMGEQQVTGRCLAEHGQGSYFGKARGVSAARLGTHTGECLTTATPSGHLRELMLTSGLTALLATRAGRLAHGRPLANRRGRFVKRSLRRRNRGALSRPMGPFRSRPETHAASLRTRHQPTVVSHSQGHATRRTSLEPFTQEQGGPACCVRPLGATTFMHSRERESG